MENHLTIFRIVSSIFHLVRFKVNCMPKIRLLACLILEIAMKKTLKSRFERWPHNILNFFSIFLLVRLKASYMPKISFLCALEVGFGWSLTMHKKIGLCILISDDLKVWFSFGKILEAIRFMFTRVNNPSKFVFPPSGVVCF